MSVWVKWRSDKHSGRRACRIVRHVVGACPECSQPADEEPSPWLFNLFALGATVIGVTAALIVTTLLLWFL